MAWAYAFEAPRGTTIKSSRFLWVSHFDMTKDLWWSDDLRKWAPLAEIRAYGFAASNCAPCRSYRAFRRHLKNHPELRGVDPIILMSRYEGYNIKALWIDE